MNYSDIFIMDQHLQGIQLHEMVVQPTTSQVTDRKPMFLWKGPA